MIFEYVHNINALADATPGVLRLSMDAKAAIKVVRFPEVDIIDTA